MRKAASANYQNEAELLEGCALATAMIGYVSHGLRRFGELRAVIPNISEKMLYQQPRELARSFARSLVRSFPFLRCSTAPTNE